MTKSNVNSAASGPRYSPPANSQTRLVILFLLLCFALYPSLGCRSSAPGSKQEELVRPVRFFAIKQADDKETRSFPGRVEASKRVELAFQVPGLLINLPVTEGQRINKGDIVARLRDTEFEARRATLVGQLDQARSALSALQAGERAEERMRRESQVRAAEARLANARADLDRMTRLVAQNAVSRADFDRAETSFRVAQEEYNAALQLLEKGATARIEDIEAQEGIVRALEGRVAEAEIQLKDTVLKAPYDGVIAEVFVRVNQSIQPSQPILRYQNLDEIDIAVDIPEAIMATSLRGADIIAMEASFSGLPGLTFPVRIREFSQFADPVTQTFTVRFAMSAPQDVKILPGMTGSVTASRSLSEQQRQIRIPLRAVVTRPAGEAMVWVIGADNTVTAREIKLGGVVDHSILVESGLQVGDRIASAGVSSLREGMRVRDLGDALGASR